MRTFAGWLLHTKTIDGPGELGRLIKEWDNRNPDGYDSHNLSFVASLRLRYPEDWVAYQAYLRLINKDTQP
jgi:hypothetical protein